MSKELRRELVLEEPDVREKDLLEKDYVVWTVSINNELFTFYHGFPGDNPRGVLTKGESIVLLLFEGTGEVVDKCKDVGATAFLDWYTEDTKEGCSFEREEYRAFDLSQKRLASVLG